MIKITQTMIEVTQTMVDLPHPTPKMTDPVAGTPAPEPEEDNPMAIRWRAGREEMGTVRGGGGAEGGMFLSGVLGVDRRALGLLGSPSRKCLIHL
jgi:hypothetical protein